MQTCHDQYDAAVIGSADGGAPLAMEFARAGFRTLLLHSVPGEPAANAPASRSLMTAASMARLARRARNFGVETGNIAVDLGKAQMRRQAFIGGQERAVTQGQAATSGLSEATGQVRFGGTGTLRLESATAAPKEIRASRIFINTGVLPVKPELAGLEAIGSLDGRSALEIDELPDHLLVLGGSYAGLELAQMFRRFGSRVSIVERHGQLLSREDRDVAAVVAEMFREDGMEVFLETEALEVAGTTSGVRLRVRTPSGEHVLNGSRLLAVASQKPNTEGLDLGAAGVEVDSQGYIKVNERLETSVPGIYALGGVNGGPAFPNVAYDDLRIVRANVIDRTLPAAAGRLCPYTAFTDPQLARIGMTETQARSRGRKVKVAKLPMRRVARAVELNETQGLIKVVIDGASGRIVGAAVLGVDSGEIMAMLQIAMMANMPYSSLRAGTMAHPTLASTLENLFATLDG